MSVRIEMKVFNDLSNLLSVEVLDDKLKVTMVVHDKANVDYFSIADMRRLARFILDEAKETEQ